MEEKAYTYKQVEYMLKLEYQRGLKDGRNETKESVLNFLEAKKAN